MRFSLNESARRDVETFFEENVQAAAKRTAELFEGLVEIYTREQYKPLWKMTNSIGQFYSEEFSEDLFSRFLRWTNSDTSLCAFAQKVEASDDQDDDSLAAAQMLEAAMEDVLKSTMRQEIELPVVSMEVQLTKDINEIFEEIQDLVTSFERDMEALISTSDSEAENKSEENQIFANISEILGAILQAFHSLFGVFKEGVEILGAHIGEKGNSAAEMAEADKEQLRGEAESAGDALRDVAGLFDFD